MRLRAVGTAYLRFAQAEPGLFRTAFSAPPDRQHAASPGDDRGMGVFRLLAAALDELVAAGVLARRRRRGAGSATFTIVMFRLMNAVRNSRPEPASCA